LIWRDLIVKETAEGHRNCDLDREFLLHASPKVPLGSDSVDEFEKNV